MHGEWSETRTKCREWLVHGKLNDAVADGGWMIGASRIEYVRPDGQMNISCMQD